MLIYIYIYIYIYIISSLRNQRENTTTYKRNIKYAKIKYNLNTNHRGLEPNI
jgi:hypothetical protein